jgi:hypothetical protein
LKIVKVVVTHRRPHLDEAAAIALLREYGGLDRAAQVEFVDAGYEDYLGQNPEKLEAQGILQIGVGSGRFNEHASSGLSRQKGETSATLVAKALGVDKKPEVAYVLRIVRANDISGKMNPTDLAHSMRVKYQDGQSDQKVLEWAIEEIATYLRVQRRFHALAVPELKKARIREVKLPVPDGAIKIATIRSDNDQIFSAARSKKYGRGISILVVERLSGNIQVLPTRQDLAAAMVHAIARIRLAEAKLAGLKIEPLDPRLFREAAIEGVPKWHFQVETGMCLNGSLTATGVEPTRLTLEQVAALVERGILFSYRPEAAYIANLI